MTLTLPPVRGIGDTGHVNDSNLVRQALLDLEAGGAADMTAHAAAVNVHVPPAAAGASVGAVKWDESSGRRLMVWDDKLATPGWQMVYGDTGWRDVSAGFMSGWTGSLYLRRIGYTVMLSGAAIYGTHPEFYNPPTGFRVNQVEGFYVSGAARGKPGNALAPWQCAATVYLWGSAGESYALGLRWQTSESWPTALPGTASGSIPTG